ncbi:hypothetical protein AEAC466_15690 [Asticcacaulis sp. AC466]|uniref:alpha/beta hydrolase family protein n=1 Tax=Asticcacaulis sp. AC466 TaxID=1282362 RepID=UPI0003C3D7A4|nr:prolyl oligopeptidase family serine peptidase [Asticcacaulis sp. AC466]ESQ82946.1 hypothetical protein AEAC466_15690 [Asticcacaulis sp. AC466]
MTRGLTALAFVLSLVAPPVAAQSIPADSTEVIVKGAARPKLADTATPPPLDVFVKPPRIEQIALSADGGRIAFVTWTDGLHILAIYNVADNSRTVVRLADAPLSAISWLDKDHILLSSTLTGLRGTCPSGTDQRLADGAAQMNLRAVIDPAKADSVANADAQARALSALRTPGCVQFGVRAQDAVTVVDLRTAKGTTLGNKLSEFDNLALGLPRPIIVDGKMQVMGAFLEMRAKSIAGQPTRRVYLWRTDPDTGIGRLVNDGGGDLDRENRYVDDWLFDASGQILARSLYSFRNETFSIEIRKDKGWTPVLTRKIVGKDRTFAPFLAGLGRDGASLLLLDIEPGTEGSARRFHYYELSADGKRSEALDPDDATRDRPIFHPETGALAGFERDGETPTYIFFDPDLAEYYKLAVDTAPGQAVRVAAMARDPRQMILFDQGGDDPGSWHYYDFAAGKRVDIGSHYPAVPMEWVASQRSIQYKARDGMDIHALLTLPPKGDAKNRALVVLPHDGPLAHDARGFDWLAQLLASRGYVVLQPNYRGSDGYGTAYTDAGTGEWAGRMLGDLADGVRALSAQGLIDPGRVCIAGRGYGGYAALMGAESHDGPYRCAASIGGISDLSAYSSAIKSRALADEIAPLKADPKQSRSFRADPASPSRLRTYLGAADLAAISPLQQVKQAHIPVLLIHGGRDADVSPSQSHALRDALRAAGKAVTAIDLPDCDHDLTKESCRLATAQGLVDFLTQYNPPN